MAVASVVGLLLPALDEGSARLPAAPGWRWDRCSCSPCAASWTAPSLHVAGMDDDAVRRSALVFVVLFVHSAPEGLAIGTAYASDTAGLGLFVILAIALQNVPEGTSMAIPMAAAGFGRAQQFWAAVVTSAPQPIAALIAYPLVEEINGLLPISFAFAAGAMLSLVAFELLPQAFTTYLA